MNRNRPNQQPPQQQFRFNKVNTAPQKDNDLKRKLDNNVVNSPSNGDGLIKKLKQEENENIQNENSVQNDQSKRHLQILNDLTIYHKFKVKYDVISESGPQHAKLFQVKCTIYDPKTESDFETYMANGSSINKAKQSAAEMALAQTKLEKPTNEQMKKRRAVKPKPVQKEIQVQPKQTVRRQEKPRVNTNLNTYELDCQTLNKRYLLTRHSQVQPDKTSIELINFILKRIEYALKQTSDKLLTDTINQLENKEIDKETYRELKGVFRIGYFGKGIFLKKDTDIDLVITLNKHPDFLFCKKIFQDLNIPSLFTDNQPDGFKPDDIKINFDSLKTDACIQLFYNDYKFRLFFTCEKINQISELVEENFYLPNEKLCELNELLVYQKWFDMKLKPISNSLLILRVLRDFCSKDSDWCVLDDKLLENLVQKCFVVKKYEDVGLKFRQFFEIISAGVLLLPKLEMTCKYLTDTVVDLYTLGDDDRLDIITREKLTLKAQEALRLIVFKKINVLLGMELIGDESLVEMEH